MIVHQNVFLPDGEKHLQGWMDKAGEIVDGKGTYQVKKLRKAVSYCKQFRTAVDVGAHVGLWSMQLEKRFADLHAFEPVAEHRACFLKNVPCVRLDPETRDYITSEAKYATLHACALGQHEGMIKITTAPTSSGDSWVDGDGDIPMRLLDSFDLHDVDFMKIDCEGSELFVLRGAEKTIRRWMPVIIVEQKPGHAQRFGLGERDAILYLQTLGYRQAEEMAGDFIMVPA